MFDGYGRSASTKAAEQQRRVTQFIYADIMFECDMKTTTTQKTFLANSKNEARLIDKLLRIQLVTKLLRIQLVTNLFDVKPNGLGLIINTKLQRNLKRRVTYSSY